MAEEIMHLDVVTPERSFYSGDVSMVEMTTTEGDVGIYPRHIPMTMIVAPGILTITEPDGTKKSAALMEGFVEITQEAVNILAEVAEWPGEIDEERAKKARERAQRRLEAKDANVNFERAEMSMKRALTRLKLKE